MFYSKTKTWIIIGIIATLSLGFILGVVSDRGLSVKRHRHWLTYKRKDVKILKEERILNRLTRKLDLSQPQIQAIGGILRMQAQQIQELREEQKNKMESIMKETREKIKQHLTPQQQEEYEKLIESHRRRWEKISDYPCWQKS